MKDYWEENGIEKPQAIVVCAACRVDGALVCGARHFDNVMRDQMDLMPQSLKWARAEQGFINQFGEFLTREEAMIAAKASGRPLNIEHSSGEALFSECLY